jgi:D-amino-acid dehydrogenase
MRIIVIGAGIVGVSTAHFLSEAGAEVLLVDRQPGPGLETSARNGSLLHPSLVEPWNSPGILRVMLRNLGKEDSAMLLRLRALPSLLGWGLEFVRQSSPQRFERNALRNTRLAQYSLRQYAEIRARTGITYDSYRRGTLTLFRDEPSFRAATQWYRGLERVGLEVHTLDPRAAIAQEPALEPIVRELVGAMYAPHDEGGDPLAYCKALAQSLASRGVTCRFDTPVTRLIAAGGSVSGIELASGEQLLADRCVLAAGSYSLLLARSAGLELPIRPAKGYSLTLPRDDTGLAPRTPIADSSLHMAVVPVGEDRLRVAGTAEFTGFDTTINPARIANLMGLLRRVYPRYAETVRNVDPQGWVGLRPMCADGVPLIGRSRVEHLWLNVGHGHTGWTLGAGAGRLAADLVLGRPSEIDAGDYSPARFGC